MKLDQLANTKPLLTRALLLLGMAGLPGCGGCSGGQADGNADNAVVVLEQDDAEIAAARQEARQSVGRFLQALANPSAEQNTFAVKMRFDEGDRVEYMWLTDLRIENGLLVGVVNNEPTLLQQVHRGDTYAVSPVDIDDWMFMENQEMVGGYSIAVLRERQSSQNVALAPDGATTLQR